MRAQHVVIASGIAYALALVIFAVLRVTSFWSLLPLGAIFAVMLTAARKEALAANERSEADWAANQNIATRPVPPL